MEPGPDEGAVALDGAPREEPAVAAGVRDELAVAAGERLDEQAEEQPIVRRQPGDPVLVSEGKGGGARRCVKE